MNPTLESHALGTSSRREFLKLTTTAAAAATLGTVELARSAHAAGSDTLRVGMVGCGGRNAGAAVQALKADPGARLVAMGDIFLDRVKAKRQEIKENRPDQVSVSDDQCFTGFDAYKQVIERCDVVLIANAAKFHPLHSWTAIQAGKHVFVEKPHGIDPAGLRVMQQAVDLAKQKGLSVASGLHSRHHPGYAETIQRIHDGAIGEIVTIEENFLRAPYGVIARNPALSEIQWQCSTQYHFVWLSGDDVVQSLVHNLDRANWAMGGQVPVKCHGLGGRSAMFEGIYGNVFDHHSVVYEYENGVRIYALCRTTTGCYDESSSLIFGSKGRANVTSCRIWGEKPWRWQGSGDPYQIEHDKLFAGIRSGKPVNNGDYMVRSTLTAVMGQLSCYTGKEVTWSQMQDSNFAFAPKPEECHDGMAAPVCPDREGSYPVYVPGKTVLL